MKQRFVILFWLLLLVPTFLISAYLFQLLRREQVRMAQAVYSTAMERARNINETIQLTTNGVEQTITQALLLLPRDDLQRQLFGFVRATDLISDAFIWSPADGLLCPGTGAEPSVRERRFVERYEDLFSGKVSWQEVSVDTGGGLPLEITTPYQESLTQKIRKKKRQGWIPWLHEDRLSLLGWVQPGGPEAVVYGVEMNLDTLLAWLVNYFPDRPSQAVTFALRDSRGEVLYQTGDAAPPPSGAPPDIVLPLAPSLPHWKLVISIVDPALAGKSGKGFMILAGLLIAIFIVAIILGGAMLSWQANRNMMFAQQKTTFVSNVSHELKTPLTSIRMYAELLKEERVKDPEKKNHYLQVIVSESQRLTRLVNNVLDFGRLEQGKKQYHFRDLDLAEFLRGVVETQRLSVQKAGMVLENEIPQQSFRVRIDPDALEQVLLNLMDNAIKYAAGGKELTVDLKSLDDHFRLMVFDRGPGIAVRHRERIFHKFHRVDNSLTTRQPGSGLGLSIARSIMRELEGDICYEPRAGGGSCFVVLIPYRPARDAETSPRATESV